MASWEDVDRIASALPETVAGSTWGNDAWKVRDKTFVWSRPLNKADLSRWTDGEPPAGVIVAARVADLDEKDALVTEEPEVFFTIEHFKGFPAVLIRLDEIDVDRLDEVLTAAWLVQAPKRLAQAFRDRSD